MKIFVEGGGDSARLKASCRRAFGTLLRQVLAQRPGCRLRLEIVACGSRNAAYDKFCAALEGGETEIVLLVDSEDVVTNLDAQTQQTRDPWQHFSNRGDPWIRPAGATNDHAQLMGVSMETWLVADQGKLAAYYGQHFHLNSLPRHAQLEQVAKPQLYGALELATRATTKGAYSKGSHSFDVLEQLDYAQLEQRLPHVKRLFDYLRSKC
ncbi:DUF4276 family protein [uncultured Hymenobacter sp.]|uniref:DUF4276 family protein n=1 Tax=uncultured Hymenobacter sp. TaxID=170016 RepID=UPI0035CA1068